MMKTTLIDLAIADDSDLHRQLLVHYANMHPNFKITIVSSNGNQLLDDLLTSNKRPQICILDLHMPVLDGIETAKLIASKYPELYLFGYTSSAEKDEIEIFAKFVCKVYSKYQPQVMFDDIFYLFNK